MNVNELLEELERSIDGHPLKCGCNMCITRDTITEILYQVHLRTGVSNQL